MSEGHSDDDLVGEIEAAVEDGERDLCAGGVAVSVLAERLDRTPGQVRRRCKRLVETGRLIEADGVDRDSYQPRTGFLPARNE